MDNSHEQISKSSKVSSEEWKRIMPLYREQQKDWILISSIFWVILIMASIALVYYVQNWWSLLGIIIGYYSAAQLGSRSGNIDGFQIGYEWGKEQAVMQMYGISAKKLNEIRKNERN